MIIIEDPKMLETLDKKMTDVIRMNDFWKKRADDHEGRYRDAATEAGYWKGKYEEREKRDARQQEQQRINDKEGAIVCIIVVVLLLVAGGGLGYLIGVT